MSSKEIEPEQSPEERVAWLRERGVLIEFPEDRKPKAKAVSPENKQEITIVKIPWNESEPFSEITVSIEKNVDGDQLLEVLKSQFVSNPSESVDMDKLNTLAKSQFAGNESLHINESTVQSLSRVGSVEAFSLSYPSEATNYLGVNLYLDEVGQLKHLPSNPRAIALARSCGFENVPLVGDMFVGRVLDDPYSRMGKRSISFSLTEMDSGSDWLQGVIQNNFQVGKLTNRVQMDSDRALDCEGVEKEEDSSSSTSTSPLSTKYRWSETSDTLEVRYLLPSGVTSKDIKVNFTSSSFTLSLKPSASSTAIQTIKTLLQESPVSVAGYVFLSLTFPSNHRISVDDSTWTCGDKEKREIEILMEKTLPSGIWGKIQ